VAVHADVVFAPPATAIIDTADESSIVAMTTHGRTGLARFVLGSVASLVVRSLAAPVLVVRPFTVPSGDLDRILVPLDGSAAAESVVPVVAALAPAFGARVHLLMVRSDGEGLDGDYLQGVAARLHDAGVQDVSEEVVAGHPAETITKVAGERRMKLIALATHGWGGLRRRAFGSVTDQILHGAMLPVLLVRARAAGA
jgi:nucleotide-binding universal stress UspA family protein